MRKKEQKILRDLVDHVQEIATLTNGMESAGGPNEPDLNKLIKTIRKLHEKTVVLRYLHVNFDQEEPAPATEEPIAQVIPTPDPAPAVEPLPVQPPPPEPQPPVAETHVEVEEPAPPIAEESTPAPEPEPTPIPETPPVEAMQPPAPTEEETTEEPPAPPVIPPAPEVEALRPEPTPEASSTPAISAPDLEREMKNLDVSGSEESINDIFSQTPDTSSSVADRLQRQPISNLRAAIGLNERFLYSNELFNGNMEVFVRALDEINHMQTLDDAKRFLEHQQRKFNWDSQSPVVGEFLELVERRFL